MSKRHTIITLVLLSSAAVAHAGTATPTKPQKPRIQQPAVHAETDDDGYPVVGNIVQGKGPPRVARPGVDHFAEKPVTLAALEPRYIARIFSR